MLNIWQGCSFANEGCFMDVTFVFDDQQNIKSNKALLSAASSFFKNLLLESSDSYEDAHVFLHDYDSNMIADMITFIHTGQVKTKQESFNNILQAFGIKADLVHDANKPIVVKQEFLKDASRIHDGNSEEKTVITKEFNFKKEKKGINMKSCTECKYTSKWRGDLNKHINAKHKGIQFLCDMCDAKFLSKQNYEKHKATIHDGVRYNCDNCPYVSKCESSIKYHQRAKHEGVRFPCTECDLDFVSNSTLKKHIEIKHLGIKFACDECDFEATRNEYLKFHIECKHTKDINYSCDHCEFTAVSKRYVKVHTRKMHEMKTYSCKDCPFTTTKFSQYKKHRVVAHTGEKIVCSQCDFVTLEKYKLENHRNTKHLFVA